MVHLRGEFGGLISSSEKVLAAEVLRQAAGDIRRFRDAKDAVGRAMYSEASSWFNTYEPEWPYSFVNVCQTLGLCSKTVFAEVFGNKKANWYLYSCRKAVRIARSAKESISGLLPIRKVQHLAVAKS